MHVIHQLLKAYTLFHKDEQYIIGEDGSVVIVDEFTGRQMAGRRWSDGLHQAVEAKEGVEIRGETQTLATITIQNYFRMYDKLAGMTGTAETEENEFHQIYNLDVLVIPTNRPVVRDDRDDLIFRTKREKFVALMDEIERLEQDGAAGPGRDHERGGVRDALPDAQAPGPEAQRPQRQAPQEGIGDRGRGRDPGRRDHRHEHGRAGEPTSSWGRVSPRPGRWPGPRPGD